MANVRAIGDQLTAKPRFEFSASLLKSPAIAQGYLLDSKPNKNKWFVDVSEYPSLVNQIKNHISVRYDHGSTVASCIGKSLDADIQGDQISVLLEIGDKEVADKLRRKYVSGLSLHGFADELYCEHCERPVKRQGSDFLCEAHGSVNARLKKVRLKEISVVSDPAWDSAQIVQVTNQ